MADETIHSLFQSLRDIVFNSPIEHLFLKNVNDRYKAAACLDTLEDAQCAVDYYRLRLSQDQTGKEELYLVVYGVLQGVFLQQDALRNLADVLCFPFQIDKYPGLKQIRDIRNQIIGHPTSYTRKQTESYHAINRWSLSLATFDVMEYNKQDGQPKVTSVNMAKVLADNETHTVQALQALRSKLESDINDHKAEFRDKPLSTHFHPSLDYLCGKIWTGASDSRRESDRVVAAAALKSIEAMLCEVRKALSERGKSPEAWAGVDLALEELHYPMTKLSNFYLDADKGFEVPEPETARIYAWYVKHRLHKLRKMCQEIDEYYDGNEVL